jgi:hypothetical protein
MPLSKSWHDYNESLIECGRRNKNMNIGKVESLDVEPVIAIRNNATTRGCPLRTGEVPLIKKGYQSWKQI